MISLFLKCAQTNVRFVALSLFVLIISFTTSSCNQNIVFEKNTILKNEQWTYADKQTFEVEIKDTVVHYNLSVALRHSFHFEWRNLWVDIETVFPDGRKTNKRVNLLLSEADGKWFGDCTGDNCDIHIPIQENAIFPQTGIYKFTIAQDMRVNPLENIRSVGLVIEKYRKN